MIKKNVVFTAKEGTGTSIVVPRIKVTMGNMLRLPVMAKIVATVAGETPAAIVKLQGYQLASSSWVDLGSVTIEEAGTFYIHAVSIPRCMKYRLNITPNVGVTVVTAEIGAGRVPT